MGWIRRPLLGGIAAPTQRMEEVVAREIGWSTVIRALGWLVALTFVLATFLTFLFGVRRARPLVRARR
ncbi:hypothetical protein BH18ACT6_BH18ACT6_07290 [soil metagenome]